VVYVTAALAWTLAGLGVTTLLALGGFAWASTDATPVDVRPYLWLALVGAPLLVFLAPFFVHRLTTVTTQLAASFAGMFALCCLVVATGVSAVPAMAEEGVPPAVIADAFGYAVVWCAMPLSVAVVTAAVHVAVRSRHGVTPLPPGWVPAPVNRPAAPRDTGEILLR
jgi:hypothetical protein